MNSALLKVAIASALIALLWAFVGVERIVGDHETGVSWDLFIKKRPSLQLQFQNPAQNGLEIVPVRDFSQAEQSAFIDFCAIRFGISDAIQCRAVLVKRVV